MEISKIHILSVYLTFVILTISTKTGDSYSITIPADSNSPGKCMYRSEELKLGINAGPLPCQQLTCNADGSVLVEGCGKVRLEGCNRGERINADQQYPLCCKQRFKCKRSDGSSYYEEMDLL